MTTHGWETHYPEGVSWQQDIEPKPLYELLDAAAQQYPNNIAVDFLNKKFSYQDVHRMAERFAAGLQALGVNKGDRVGLLLPNCPQHIIAYFGILKAGGIVVNFSPLAAEREVQTQVRDSGAKVMVTARLELCYPKLAPLLESGDLSHIIHCGLEEALPFPVSLIFPLVKAKDIAKPDKHKNLVAMKDMVSKPAFVSEVTINPEKDIAVLQYTGGTTGIPKGAGLTHANLYANAKQCASWMVGLERGKERMMGVLPFFHVFAMTVSMNLAIEGGHTIIMHPKFELKKVLKDIHKKKPTLMPGVPTMYNAIANAEDVGKYDLSSIKACISGGAALPIEVKEAFEKITGCALVEGYGLTEASPVCACNPLFGTQKTGSIGLPLPDTIIEIRDKDDHSKPMPTGEIGELCIRGPQVMTGYWERPEETSKCLEDGLLRTGDLGYQDEEGYTFIVDRLKEMIITGGFNVYPRHVEEAIYEHEAVLECAVIGIPDKHFGQVVKAYIALKENMQLQENELRQFLGPRLSKYQIPKEIEFRESLPKTMIGKISKKDL